jgi:hypothetical protein
MNLTTHTKSFHSPANTENFSTTPVDKKGRSIMVSADVLQHFLTIDDGSIDDTGKGITDVSASVDTAIPGYDEARDEIKEIQNISRTETRLIRTWRIILLAL